MKSIGNYNVIRELGSGGFGRVYLCEDSLGNQLAIKILTTKSILQDSIEKSSNNITDEALKQYFQEEAKILHTLSDNPYIVNFMHYDETSDGMPFYVMPYLSRSLVDEIGKDAFTQRSKEALDPELYPCKTSLPRAIDVLEQTAKALSAVHKIGLVHRDIKPANLLVNQKGGIQLCDFGIAELAGVESSRISIGSRHYMSPEQLDSKAQVGASSDIYSLGVIAYRLITGILPIGNFDEPIELRPNIGVELNKFILQCLQLQPEKRPSDAQAFLLGLSFASKSIVSQLSEFDEHTSTQQGDLITIKGELNPLKDKIFTLLEEQGEVSVFELPALRITANMLDLDEMGLAALINEVFISNQGMFKPKQKLRNLIRDRIQKNCDLNKSEYQEFLFQCQQLAWGEDQLRLFIKEAESHSQHNMLDSISTNDKSQNEGAEKEQEDERVMDSASHVVDDTQADFRLEKTLGLIVIVIIILLIFLMYQSMTGPITNTIITNTIEESTAQSIQKSAMLVENDSHSLLNEIEKVPSKDQWLSSMGIPDIEMVLIPEGHFLMGAENGIAAEKPVHVVAVSAFKIMSHELTWEQYQPCIDAGICENNASDGGDNAWGKANRPVIEVSWFDATTYAQWLSENTDETYRLPSEAEWEYAARAGTTTNFNWGDDVGRNRANCDGCGSQWDNLKTAPVGSFKANLFGLYDVHGNVWEWTQDCWRDSYQHISPAMKQDECIKRVVRGGSWFNLPDSTRSSTRFWLGPNNRSHLYGFRLVQELKNLESTSNAFVD